MRLSYLLVYTPKVFTSFNGLYLSDCFHMVTAQVESSVHISSTVDHDPGYFSRPSLDVSGSHSLQRSEC